MIAKYLSTRQHQNDKNITTTISSEHTNVGRRSECSEGFAVGKLPIVLVEATNGTDNVSVVSCVLATNSIVYFGKAIRASGDICLSAGSPITMSMANRCQLSRPRNCSNTAR